MKTEPRHLGPSDFARALAAALRQAPPPLDTGDVELGDQDAYFAAGQRVGIPRQALQAALEAVARDRAQRTRTPAADEQDSPRFRITSRRVRAPGDLQPAAERRRAALLASGGLALAALLVVATAIALQSGPDADPDPVASAASQPVFNRATGTIDVEAFRSSLEELRNKVRTCARSDFNRLALALTISLSARIGLDGKAADLKVVNDPLDSPAVRACVEKEVSAYEFPKPQGAPVEVDFQLSFDANPSALKNRKPSR
ncbi:MAG: hypothetical protein JXR83_07695 [Deltaproteobacteria bacterium]|nr:hypothetical protein [Deltaproteobacteria bacterium]